MSRQDAPFNLIDSILFQCRNQPPAAAICAPGAQIGLVSYRRLEQFIHNACRRVLALGISPGSVVAVDVREPVLHVVIVLALMRVGAVSTSLSESVLDDLGVEAIISDRATSSAGSTEVRQIIPVDLSWTEGDGTPVGGGRARPGGAEKENLCRIILTSGTTGTPKAVGVSHKLLFDRAGRHLTAFGNRLPACSRILSDMNLRSSLGFQFLIYTLLRGGTFFFTGDIFENTLAALEEYKVQCVVASPAGLETFLRFYEKYPLYQSKLDLLITAGDLLPESLSDRVRSRLCSHLVNVYGSTEASVTATAPAHALALARREVGYVAPGVSVEVVNESGDVLPPASEGIIRVRSAFAVDRYLGRHPESQMTFRDGWFYPGDLGTVSQEGLLAVTGRQKAVLSIGGDKISPETIEAALAAYGGVDECAAFSVPNQLGNEQVWAAIVTNANFNQQKLHEHCRATLPVQFLPSAFVLVDKLARNVMGKIERERLKELASGAPDGSESKPGNSES
jgi:acyl-CoA synthetase (AMP-forming)/AMP-acid ligase II